MLEDVRKSLPEAVFLKERFEIPKALGHIQGNRTIITNFLQIASTLRRDVSHLLKYILKELATPGNLSKSALIMGRKVPASILSGMTRIRTPESVDTPLIFIFRFFTAMSAPAALRKSTSCIVSGSIDALESIVVPSAHAAARRACCVAPTLT